MQLPLSCLDAPSPTSQLSPGGSPALQVSTEGEKTHTQGHSEARKATEGEIAVARKELGPMVSDNLQEKDQHG